MIIVVIVGAIAYALYTIASDTAVKAITAGVWFACLLLAIYHITL
jgi:hypothetical protein